MTAPAYVDPPDADTFGCDCCGEEKPRDEMHHGTWPIEAYFCDACAARPWS